MAKEDDIGTAQTTRVIRPVGSWYRRNNHSCRPIANTFYANSAKFNTSRHSLGLCRSVVVTCRYRCTSGASTDGQDSLRRIVEKAVATVIGQHPMLRVGIAGEHSADPVYVSLKTIDLGDVVEYRSLDCQEAADYSDRLLRSIEAQHDRLWERLDQRPAWKIIVHHRPESACLDIAFAFHHAIADGQSSLLFHSDFLRALNRAGHSSHKEQDQDQALKGHTLHLKWPTNLPEPLESIVPFTLSWLYTIAVVVLHFWTKLSPSWLKSRPPSPDRAPWTGPQVTMEPYKTEIRLLHLQSKQVVSLVSACRQNGTSLTPLLHALVLASLSTRLPAGSASAFLADTPISLRPFTEQGFDRETTMHCLVTAHEYLFDAPTVSEVRRQKTLKARDHGGSDALIWNTAAQLGRSLKAKISTLPRNDQMALLKFVSDWKQFWIDKFGKPRSDSWSVSNVGSLKAPNAGLVQEDDEPGSWQIERAIFTQGALPMGAAFSVNVAGVEGRGLWITVSWQKTIVDATLVEGLLEDLQDYMVSFAEKGHFNF